MSEEVFLDPPSAKRPKLNEGTEELHALSKDVAGIVEQPEQSGDEEGWARELSAGVCTFINSQSDPFTCIFKHRFVQFTVPFALTTQTWTFLI